MTTILEQLIGMVYSGKTNRFVLILRSNIIHYHQFTMAHNMEFVCMWDTHLYKKITKFEYLGHAFVYPYSCNLDRERFS